MISASFCAPSPEGEEAQKLTKFLQENFKTAGGFTTFDIMHPLYKKFIDSVF